MGTIPDLGRIIELSVAVFVAMLGFTGIAWGFRRQDRDERKKNEETQNQRHRDNRDDIHELINELRYNPLHTHGERKGPLTAENIRYPPPKRISGGGGGGYDPKDRE